VEMQPINGQAGAYGQAGGRDPNAILNDCRDIDRGIDAIERNLERLRFLQQRALDDPDASQNTQTNRELDALGSETMTLYRNFGARIKNIKSQKESGDARNAPQVGKVDRKLKAAINEYQQLESNFRQKLSAQMERQYRIVRPDASEQEVREAVEDTSNNQVFTQAVCSPYLLLSSFILIPVQLLQGNRRGESQSALRAVQGRHEAIQKIEKQMIELGQLFQDVDAAIIQQEPAVIDIEQKAEGTHENIGQANTQLDGAISKAKSRNRKKWICLLLFCKLSLGISFHETFLLTFNASTPYHNHRRCRSHCGQGSDSAETPLVASMPIHPTDLKLNYGICCLFIHTSRNWFFSVLGCTFGIEKRVHFSIIEGL